MTPTKTRKGTAGRTDEEVGAHYDNAARAEGLAQAYAAPTPLGEFYRDRLTRVLGVLEGVEGTLLDAGCGTGQMIHRLRDSQPGRFALTGLDRSAPVIEAARRTVDDDPDVHLVVARIEQMPFAAASFDVVLAMGILEYVARVEQALGEIARVTRPGGLAVVTMQNLWSPYRLWDATVWSHVRRRRGEVVSPVVNRLRRRRLCRELRKAGLAPFSVVEYGFNICLPPIDARFPDLALRLQRRLEQGARGPLRRLATDYLVVARRAASSRSAVSDRPAS